MDGFTPSSPETQGDAPSGPHAGPPAFSGLPEPVERNAATYGIDAWSGGYFVAGADGHVHVRPDRAALRGAAPDAAPDGAGHAPSADLHEIVTGLVDRGIETPVLIRFPGILADRVRTLRDCFREAIDDTGYTGRYTCVYPIKVNQHRPLVEELRDLGAAEGFGLEAGSKPELLAVLGLTTAMPEMPIVCNGFKDREFIRTVLMAARLGRPITPVIERFRELELIAEASAEYGVAPRIGLRIKPASSGSGRWEESGGTRSKFGLHISDLPRAVGFLREHGLLGSLRMVHAHVGSQICDIRQLKDILSELTHTYCELRRMGASNLDTLDIGGGLGVDYDGSRSSWASSRNYTTREYAREVVYRVQAVCDEAGQPHPVIMSESGRALTAQASVLIFDVLGRSTHADTPGREALRARVRAAEEAGEELPQAVADLLDALEGLDDLDDPAERAKPGAHRLPIEVFHDATTAYEQSIELYKLGYIGLPMRSLSEQLFWAVGRGLIEHAARRGVEPGDLHEDLAELPEMLRDLYYVNFSLFQSMPDHWAIDQVFPVCPIHRLDETPTRRGVLADITCDSDGQIDRFATQDHRDYKPTLELHDPVPGEPYYLGAFVVGAYQEVLGDLHNLFGDTHIVHVGIDAEGGWSVDEVFEGDHVTDVLRYLAFDPGDLRKAMRGEIERANRSGRLSVAEGRELLAFYATALKGYTYLGETQS